MNHPHLPVYAARSVPARKDPACNDHGRTPSGRNDGGRKDPTSRWMGAAAGALCLLALITAPAKAAEPINLNVRSARDLAELCGAAPKQPGSDAKINFCHGFAQATVDMALQQEPDKRPFCFPSPTPRRTQTLSEFVGWVRSSPDHQRLSSTEGLLQFLGGRFPCNK